MKKIFILLTTFSLLLFGSNCIYANTGTQEGTQEETEEANEETGTQAANVNKGSQGVNIGKTADFNQPFNISNTSASDLDTYSVTIEWNIEPLQFSINNDNVGSTYYYNPTDQTQSKIATFKVINNSKRLIKVTGSFTKNDKLDAKQISYQFTKSDYGLGNLFEETPGTDEDFRFFVAGSLLNSGSNSLLNRAITSTVTVNELAFKNYRGAPSGNIGQYHFTVQAAS